MQLRNSTSSPSSSSCCLLRAYLWLQHYLQQQPPVRLRSTPGPIPSCCLLRAYPTSGSNTTPNMTSSPTPVYSRSDPNLITFQTRACNAPLLQLRTPTPEPHRTSTSGTPVISPPPDFDLLLHLISLYSLSTARYYVWPIFQTLSSISGPPELTPDPAVSTVWCHLIPLVPSSYLGSCFLSILVSCHLPQPTPLLPLLVLPFWEAP